MDVAPQPPPEPRPAAASTETLRLPCREEQADFPLVGARARRWGRFERDLGAWLASPDGCFATWRAREAIGASAQPPR